MGTAHGDIKIGSDTRGVDQATASVSGFKDAIKSLTDAAVRFQAASDKLDSALNDITRNYEQADRAANKFNRDADSLTISINRQVGATKSVSAAHRQASGSTKDWSDNVATLASKLIIVNTALAEMEYLGQRVSKMSKSFSDLGGPVGLARSFIQLGGAKTGLKVLETQLLGIDKALRTAPNWQKNVIGLGNSLKNLTVGVAILSKLSTYSSLWTRAAQSMFKVSQDAGLGMLVFGDRVGKATSALGRFAAPLAPAMNALKNFNTGLDKFATSSIKAVGGMALMRSGFQGLNSSFGIFGKNFQTGSYWLDLFLHALKFAFLPGVILSSAAVQSLGKTLEFTSNLVAGLWNGIQQLSGGFLAIPGLIANIGAAVGTGAVIFSTLKEAFKAIGSAKGDVDKINAAIAAMPPYLRPLGQAVVDLTPKWKDFQNTITNTFTTGAETQLKALATALPVVATGSIQVSNSMRQAKDALVGFVAQGATMSAMLTVFGNTSQIINVIASQIPVVATGLRDLAVVGSSFMRDLATTYLPVISAKFGEWATNAASTGKAMQWMENSVEAVKGLVKGTVQLTEALYGILTVFKTPGSDQNYLSKYSAEMTKFNDAVKQSLSGGYLRRIGDDIRSWGTDKLKEVHTLFQQLEPAFKAAYNILKQMSATFSAGLMPLLQAAAAAVSTFVQVFNSLGGGYALGTILALNVAFGLLMKALVPLGNIIKIVIGALAFKSGAEGVILGVATALEKIPVIGSKASSAILGIGDSLVGLLSTAAAVATVIAVVWTTWSSGVDEINKANDAMVQSSMDAKKAVTDLSKAFFEDNGQSGKSVFASMKSSLDTYMIDLKKQSDAMPGFAARFTDFFQGGNQKSLLDIWFGDSTGKASGTLTALVQALPIIGSYLNAPTGSSDKVNQFAAEATAATQAQNAIKGLGLSTEDLAKAATGSQADYQSLHDTLAAVSGGGEQAAGFLQKMRDAFTQLQTSMAQAGPGAVELANGVDKIAKSAGDTTTKLDGLKEALEGLGLLKTNEYEAAANYAKAIQGLGDAATEAIDPTQSLNNVLDKQTGLINVYDVNGRNLYNTLRPVADSFLALAANGDDVNTLWSKMQEGLKKTAGDFGITFEEITKAIASLGVDPQIVSILVKLQGQDDLHKEMGQILAQAALSVGKGVEVPVTFKDAKDLPGIAAQLNSILAPMGIGTATVNGNNLNLPPGLTPEAINAIAQQFAPPNLPASQPNATPGIGTQPGQIQRSTPGGLLLPGSSVPGSPSNIAPSAVNNLPSYLQSIVGAHLPPAPAGGPVPPVAPEPAPPPVEKDKKEKKAPEDLPKNFAGLGIPAPIVPGTASSVILPPAAQAPAVLASTTAPAPTPGTTSQDSGQLNVAPMGLDQLAKAAPAVQAAAEAITKAWQGMNDSIQKGLSDSMNAIIAFSSNATNTLNRAADTARSAGEKFGQNFAAGINSPASLIAIGKAAAAAAQKAADYMPHSPAKEGPLSGDGWSGIAGKKFSTDFAGGIADGVSNISGSVKKAAEAAKLVFAGLTKGVPDTSKNFLKQLTDLTTLAGNVQKALTGAFNTGAKLLTSLSDPFKTGGFFGKALPYERDKKVTDSDLAAKRQSGDTGIGGDLLGGASSLAGVLAPNKDDIAAAIVGEAQKRGYDRNTAIAALSAGIHESGLNSNITNASDHKGIFQEDAAKPGRDTAAGQIGWFFDQLDQLGGPGSTALKTDPLDTVAKQIEKGGYGGAALAQHAADATKLYDQVLGKAGSVGVGPDQAFAGGQGFQDNPASRAKDTGGHYDVEQGVSALGLAPLYATSGPNAYQLPQFMNDIAAKFGLKASTYASGGSLHQMGFAADFMGDPTMMEAFAQYIRTNLAGQTLQLIHQGASGQKYGIASGEPVGPGTSQPDYYSGNWGEEGQMVHWATDVAPILGSGVAGAENTQNEQVLTQLRTNNSMLDQAIKTGQNPTSTDQQVSDSLQTIKQAAIQQNQGNTPQGKQSAQALDSIASTIASNRGLTQSQDPISSAQGVIGGASQIAGDVIGDINDTIQAIGATKNTADMLVRGIANTQDVMHIIDNTQQWLSTFAQYAQTVGDVANEVGQVANAASEGEPGGGSVAGVAGIVGGVASAISGALQGVNEVIDVAQEIYQIWGSYYGNFLGFLAGGNNELMGNVQYLLDQNTGQLLAYSADNPMEKSAHPVPGQLTNPAANNQAIGQLNYYAGPGTDPREATRQMMYQVKAASYSGATAS